MWGPILLGLFYAAIYVGNGASTPYAPVWFQHRGLTGAQIGLILSAPMLARMFTAPLLGLWADSFKFRRTPLMLMGLATAGCYALMAPPMGFWGWFTIWFVASSLFAAMPPLTDVIILNRARLDGFNYGWPRGIGSAAFIMANIAMGAILVSHSPSWSWSGWWAQPCWPRPAPVSSCPLIRWPPRADTPTPPTAGPA